MTQNKLAGFYSLILLSSLIGAMDRPTLDLNNLNTLKVLHPSQEDLIALNHLMITPLPTDVDQLTHAYNQARALVQNSHLKTHVDLHKNIIKWRTEVLHKMYQGKQNQDELSTISYEEMARTVEAQIQLEQATTRAKEHLNNLILLAQVKALEHARNQDLARIASLEQENANQRWWTRALLFGGTAAAATALVVIHQKANAQPTYPPLVQIGSNQTPEEKKPTTYGTLASTAPATIASPAKPATDDSIWTRLNNTITYISQSLTGTQTEVADIKKRLAILEKQNNLSVEEWNKFCAIINKNFENDRKELNNLYNRPYPTRNEHNHLSVVFPAKDNQSKKVHGAKF